MFKKILVIVMLLVFITPICFVSAQNNDSFDLDKTTDNMSSPENRDMENGKREKFKIN